MVDVCISVRGCHDERSWVEGGERVKDMGAASRYLKVLRYERVHWSLVCPVGEVAHHSLLGVVVTLPVLCLALLSAILGLAEAAGVSVAVGSL